MAMATAKLHVGCNVDQQLKDAIDKKRVELGLSASDVIRVALKHFLGLNGQEILDKFSETRA